MDSITTIKPTSLQGELNDEPSRERSDSQYAEMARFVNEARALVQPWDGISLHQRMTAMTPEQLLEEFAHIGRNIVGAETLSYKRGLFPIAIVSSQLDTVVSAGINSRDWAKATSEALRITEAINIIEQNTATPFAEPGEVYAIAMSQLQNYLHHMPSGTGRLSRTLALIYWPDLDVVTPETMHRVMYGSNSASNALRSFTDPSISTELNSQITFLGLERFIESGPQGHGLAIPVLDSLHVMFPEIPGIIHNVEAIVERALSDYLDRAPSSKITRDSDAFETWMTMRSPITAPFIAGAYKYELQGLPPKNARTFIQGFSEIARKTRVSVLAAELSMLGNTEHVVHLLPTKPAHRDVVLDQYRAGIHFVRTGKFPVQEWMTNAPHTWTPPSAVLTRGTSLPEIGEAIARGFGKAQ